MKRIVSTIAGLLMAGSAIAETNIIVVSHGQANDPFWSVAKNGVTQAAADTGASDDATAYEDTVSELSDTSSDDENDEQTFVVQQATADPLPIVAGDWQGGAI